MVQLTQAEPPSPEENRQTFTKRGKPEAIKHEMEAMKFVAAYTSIPIPQVLKYGVDENCDNDYQSAYLEMSFIGGTSLRDTWEEMDENAKEVCKSELRGYFSQLRGLRRVAESDDTWIGASDGKSGLYDDRVRNDDTSFGPFSSIEEFSEYLMRNIDKYVPHVAPSFRQKLSRIYEKQHKVVFTHADLDPSHIFVDKTTGCITGIIDWEMAGWWPEYWEYRKAFYGSRHQGWWMGFVKDVLVLYDEEFRLDDDLANF